MRTYFIGDIHGHFYRLRELIKLVLNDISKSDNIIFLGDYIDRGEHSFEVIEFILSLKKTFKTICLKGNHEKMFFEYLNGELDEISYFRNGGRTTVNSYKKNIGSMVLPDEHISFFEGLKNFHEGDDFIAVHAGLNPSENTIKDQSETDLLWIREKFYHSGRRWAKTVIFGHTPSIFLASGKEVYEDADKNIIGIDNGVIYNRPLVCFRWPDRVVIKKR